MKINFDFYKEDVLYNTGKDEEKIIKYIMENSPEDYERIIEEDMSAEVILALSTLRNNIVYSYDFIPNSSILEMGGHLGEVTSLLCDKADKVVTIETVKSRAEAIAKRCENKDNLDILVGNIKDIGLREKFDYITLFGVLEYAPEFFNTKTPAVDLISYCKDLLKNDGKLLIATNNKYALKSYVGDIDECTNNTFDSITGYKNSKKNYKLGKKQIEDILNALNLNHYKFLYPLPDYKLPNIIFSDEYLPSSSKINGYFPYYRDESNIFFSEVDAFDTIIKDDLDMFKFFSNSYFIEISKQEFENDTRFISFNNYRKKKYRLMTKIKSHVVEKSSTIDESKEHIQNIRKNIEIINKYNIKIIDKYEDGKIISEFINDKLISQKISDNLENKEYIIYLLQRLKKEMVKYSHVYNKNEKNVFDKYSVEVDDKILEKFNYIENGFWDMIFKNCFIIEDELSFFDQEWMEKNIPVEFIIYRCIVNIEKLRSKIEEYKLFEKLNIKEYTSIFKELDKKITGEIFDEKIFKLYTRHHINPIYENSRLQGELNSKKNTVKELEKSINNLSNEIYAKDYKLSQQDNEIKKLNDILNEIYNSKKWKIMKMISRLGRKKK